MSIMDFDAVVYGSSVDAVICACVLGRGGAKVAIVHHNKHPGQPFSFGLGSTDSSNPGARALGNFMAKEFFNRITTASLGRIFLLRQTPSLSEMVCRKMLRQYGVYTFFGPNYWASSVSKTGARADSITCAGGDTFTFRLGYDGSDELDLLALAGVTLTRGRESAAQYNEPLGGFFPAPWAFTPANIKDGSGTLLPGYAPYPSLNPGDADLTQQVNGWRAALTSNSYNLKLVTKPPDYDRAAIERQAREILAGGSSYRPWGGANTNFGKQDMNNDSGYGYMDAWCASDLAGRKALFKRYYTEQASVMWFAQSDPSVPPDVRARARRLSLCNDECLDASSDSSIYGATQAGFPYGFYLRDPRRLVGQYVMTQADCQGSATKAHSVVPGQYSLDNHDHQFLEYQVGGVPGYIPDALGRAQDKSLRATTPGYNIPAESGFPLASESSNLISTKPSCSAVTWSSIRINLNLILFAEAMGQLGVKALREGKARDDVPIPELQAELTGLGHLNTL